MLLEMTHTPDARWTHQSFRQLHNAHAQVIAELEHRRHAHPKTASPRPSELVSTLHARDGTGRTAHRQQVDVEAAAVAAYNQQLIDVDAATVAAYDRQQDCLNAAAARNRHQNDTVETSGVGAACSRCQHSEVNAATAYKQQQNDVEGTGAAAAYNQQQTEVDATDTAPAYSQRHQVVSNEQTPRTCGLNIKQSFIDFQDCVAEQQRSEGKNANGRRQDAPKERHDGSCRAAKGISLSYKHPQHLFFQRSSTKSTPGRSGAIS